MVRARSKQHNRPTLSKDDEISSLEERIESESPESGYAPPLSQKINFRALPLSENTLMGLDRGEGGKKGKRFLTMTAIQNACIPHALAGKDILGAAKTGSGKTLAFLVPLVEKLYRSRWGPSDGPGAIVLSPTRELAMQIFDVLRVVGSHHDFSAGLLVGGKREFVAEQGRVGKTNIIVATPGRLLQHLEQSPFFDVGALQMLVLDEADRILDMGFRTQLHTILDYLPQPASSSSSGVPGEGRQTLLFSATQTRNVKDLARLSLHKPEYIGVHDKEASATPDKLVQNMLVCTLPHKLDILFSFIKSHTKKKTVVFFSTCTQVRFVHELFTSMQPSVKLLSLHGKIKQEKRTEIYFSFLNKPNAVLFATDLVARGLDFPSVDWVVQADAPEDKDMYIHRVGRTARNDTVGRSLLMVLPSEEPGITKMLKNSSIPIKTLSINPDKAVSVSSRAASVVAANPTINRLAKKAFLSYLRSVSFQPNKEIFDINALPHEEYATSLGLASMPSIRCLKKLSSREDIRDKKNKNYKLERLKEQIKAEKLRKKIDKLAQQGKTLDDSSKSKKRRSDNADEDPSDEEEDDLLVVKKKHDLDTNTNEEEEDQPTTEARSSQRKNKRIRVEGSTGLNKKVIFDDDGNEKSQLMSAEHHKFNAGDGIDLADANEDYVKKVRDRLAATREQDKKEERARIKEKHRKKRIDAKGRFDSDDEEEDDMAGGVTLALPDDGSDADEEDDASQERSAYESDSSSDSDSDNDVNAQEELALAMLRK